MGPLLSFSVFVATLGATRMLMGSLGSIGPGTVRLLLGLEQRREHDCGWDQG